MAHLVCEVRFTRALPARHLPSSGFGYPRDGLLPRGPGRPCFMPAAPMGFSLRSVLLGRDFPASSAGSRPACRYRKPTLDQTEVWSSWRLATRLPGTSSSRIPRGLLWAFSPQHRRMLPWAFSLSRDLTMALADFLGPASSRRLTVETVARFEGASLRSLDRPSLSLTTRAKHPS